MNLRALALAKGDFCTLEELNLASPKMSLQALVLPSGMREVSMGASPGTFSSDREHGSFTTALRDELRGRGPHTLTLTLHSEEKPTRQREAGKGRRRGSEGCVPTGDGVVCASCERNPPRTSFSKTQLSKGMARRCTACVDGAASVCASCEQNLVPGTSFSKNQLSKGMARRCKDCVDATSTRPAPPSSGEALFQPARRGDGTLCVDATPAWRRAWLNSASAPSHTVMGDRSSSALDGHSECCKACGDWMDYSEDMPRCVGCQPTAMGSTTTSASRVDSHHLEPRRPASGDATAY